METLAWRKKALVLSLAAAIVMVACDPTSSFFSDADRQSIYSLGFSTPVGKVLSGAAVSAGAPVSISLSRMSGSASPATMRLELVGSDGTTKALLVYTTGGTTPPADKTGTVTVRAIDGSLPPFTLPADLPPGDYVLTSTLTDQSGSILQKTEIVLFVAWEGFSSGALSLYPPNPGPGAAVLLEASVSREGISGTKDPWIRWSSEGRSFAAGYLSRGFDKAVWRANSLPGAYGVTAEFFPVEPSAAALAQGSPWRTETKAVVTPPLFQATDLFAKADHFLSRLAFEGDYSDLGVLAQEARPALSGLPSLEAYPGGFGARFGSSSNLSVANFPIPLKDGLVLPFSLFWRFYTEELDGDILRVAGSDGTKSWRVSLESGQPVLEVKDGLGILRSVAPLAIGSGSHDLALSLSSAEAGVSVLWTLDGRRVPSSPLARLRVPVGASAMLGGPSSLDAVWDEFAVSDDSGGSPPFFRVAAERRWQGDLLLAEGFESPSVPEGAVASGDASPRTGSLSLGPAASLAFSRELSFAKPLAIRVSSAEAGDLLSVDLAAEGELVVRVMPSGEVKTADGTTVGLLPPFQGGAVAFSLKALPEGIGVYAESGSLTARVSPRQAPRTLKLTIANPSAQVDASVASVLVRYAPELLDATDSPRMARVR